MSVLRHLFITSDYPPVGGGMARRHLELCRRLAPDMITVSTVTDEDASAFDRGETYPIVREPFGFGKAKLLPNRIRWARDLSRMCAEGIDVLHCGNIRPVGDPTWWAARQHRIPYLLYVNGGDVLIEQRKTRRSNLKRLTSRHIVGGASAIVANSEWTANVTRELASDLGVRSVPEVRVIELGTDPAWFRPDRDSGLLRQRLGLQGHAVLLTVARLVPHKGQDTVIESLARIRATVPDARYLIVGTGPDEARLRSLAKHHAVSDMVIFAGALSEDDLAEAYATADVYVGLSRVHDGVYAEGFGISFVEAMASGTTVVAGDTGGVRSAVTDGQTGLLVQPTDIGAVTEKITTLLRDASYREAFERAGREAVIRHYNWDRVAADTRQLARSVAALG
jgi:phosphatidylinositol alpha-1,6-mannosyltransferase